MASHTGRNDEGILSPLTAMLNNCLFLRMTLNDTRKLMENPVLSCPVFSAPGISDGWDAFPLTSFISNMGDGLICFLGNDPIGGTTYDSTRTNCSYSHWLVIGYVLCNVVVLGCIDRISNTKNQILERALSFAVFVAIIGLAVYDNVGMEMHSRDPEPDCDAVTAFITS
jgi:hypothetical protein